MINIQKLCAIFFGKLISFATKSLKIGGGAAAPGYYALKVYSELVKDLSRNIPKTIVITGTNGKTTTSRLIAQIAKVSGLRIIRNATGSNLERGIASALISNYTLNPRSSNPDLAIWELDEAAFNQVIPKIKPDMIIFLNAFRDQMDRYGEVDTTIKKWCQTLSKLDSQTKILINGDDNNLWQLKDHFKGKVQTFGIKDKKIIGEKALHKVKSGILDYIDYEASDIKSQDLDKTEFVVRINGQNFQFTIPMPGIYNIYNFLAAFASTQQLQIPLENITKSLENFSPAFGRVEKFTLPTPDVADNKNTHTHRVCRHKSEGYIFLIKNPVGATQVFQTLSGQFKKEDRLLLALNDKLADGTDVSWIWDTDFELLQPTTYNLQPFICSGTRAEDLALRLKYAGFEKITIKNDLKEAFYASTEGLEGRLFILPTYTALLELQSILTKAKIKKHYWKEA